MSAIDRKGAPAPLGTVAVAFSSEASRYSTLFQNLNALNLPEGSTMNFGTGTRWEVLNDLVARALEGKSYWIWFISEDHGFDPDILETLLSRDMPMVAPVVVEDKAPFSPKAWTDISANGEPKPLLLNQITGPASMIEVRGANVTGMLVRRAVFEAMGPPWFRMTQTLTESVSEDVYFNERARELGFQTFIDTSSRLSTLSDAKVLPAHRGGKWELVVDVGDDMNFAQPLRHQ